MPVARIYRMIAAEGKGDALAAALGALGSFVVTEPGCLGAEAMRDSDDPNSFLLIEKWETIGHHQAALKNLPEDAMSKLMNTLAQPPEGSYMKVMLG